MYTQNHLTDDTSIDLLISHTDKVIANYRNLVSRLPACEIYQQKMLETQIEAAWQQLADQGDRLSTAKEAVMQTITAIEHDYGKLCDDMADIGSDHARRQYDLAILQLENTHRQKLSLYELIAANVSKLERVIASGRPAAKTERPKTLPERKSIKKDSIDNGGFCIDYHTKPIRITSGDPELVEISEEDTKFMPGGDTNQKNSSAGKSIPKPVIDKELNNLYELDCLRKNKSGSSRPGVKTKEVNTIKSEESAGKIINPEQMYTWDNQSKTIRPVVPDSSCDLRESLPQGCSNLKDYLDIAAEKMEDVLTERSYKVLDYAPDRVDPVIDYTHALSKHLREYCAHLSPIGSLDRIDAEIEDAYAIKEQYQQHLFNAVGLLYEYRAAAESELRWVQANKAIAAENPSPDSLLPTTAPDILAGHQKQHTVAIEKIDTELKSLEALISYCDKKSFPYRDPKKNIHNVSKEKIAEPAQPQTKVRPPLDDKETAQPGPGRTPASGRSADSAIYTYRYRSWRNSGTQDLLSATQKCIDHLLKFNAILPAVDMKGYSDCIQAESQYALKEKHKLDLIQMIGHLNAHRAELTSEINKLDFWISHPVQTDDPRFDLAGKQRQLNEKRLSYNRFCAQIAEMIEKAHAAVLEVDLKLWPGKKPRDKFELPERSFTLPEDIHIDRFDFEQ